MSAITEKAEDINRKFHEWYVYNQKTIHATILIVFAWCLLDPTSITNVSVCILSTAYAILQYILSIISWLLEHILDNQTIGAAAGAFFAFELMLKANKLEKAEIENKHLIRIRESLEMNLIKISENIGQIERQLKSINEDKEIIQHTSSPFVYFENISERSLLEINDTELIESLLFLKQCLEIHNTNMTRLSDNFTSKDAHIEGDFFIIAGNQQEISTMIDNLNQCKEQLKIAKKLTENILHAMDKS